jgi:hypothetical protein
VRYAGELLRLRRVQARNNWLRKDEGSGCG